MKGDADFFQQSIMEKKRNKKKIIIIVSVIAILGLGGVGIVSAVQNTVNTLSESAYVFDDAMLIEEQDLSTSISVSGSVGSSNLVNVTTTLNAKVKTLNVGIGDYVNKGDVLCIFDNEDIQRQYDDLKESIDKAKAIEAKTHESNLRNLENAKEDKNIALRQAQQAINEAETACDNAYNNYNALVDKYNATNQARIDLEGSLDNEENYQKYVEYQTICSQIDEELAMLEPQLSSYDNAVKSAYDAYNSTKRNSDMSIQSMQDILDTEELNKDDSAEKQLEELKKQLEECTVKATQNGIITSLNIAEGSIATTDAIMTIEDTDQLKISVQIKPVDILKVKEGLKAVIKTDATEDKEINGTVTRVVNILSGANQMTQEAGGYTAEITIDDKDTQLLIGMNAKVKIILEQRDKALAVPYDAIIDDEEEGTSHVFIAQPDGDGTYTAKKVTVEKGLESDYFTEIISSEIKAGDVILTVPELIFDGKDVSIDEIIFENETADEE